MLILNRPDIYKATASNGTSCPQSQECMSSNLPDFFRSGSRLRVRASDFRNDHIAILCLGPDDFVDVVHDDFPLCEKQ